jgi:hypothetical protein
MKKYTGQLRSVRDARRVQTVCRAMVSRFGGLDKFAAEWHRQYNLAADGSRLKHQYLAGIFAMLQQQ